ncbi:MAG: hypothetical protein ACI9FR_001470 [Cryomorphaceae bacterium]|jgi:hypothetical protein
MAHIPAGLEAGLFSDKFRYERHRPGPDMFVGSLRNTSNAVD